MKVVTWNVNGIRARELQVVEWLEREKPDVLCLQELKAADEAFPTLALKAAGYGAVWHGQKSWNGVAILERGADPVETRRGLPGEPDSHNHTGQQDHVHQNWQRLQEARAIIRKG